MAKVQVFDPAMCCPTGVCGPEVDPALVRFAADLEWLKANGVEVERFNLSQQPAAFVANGAVAAAMRACDDALPVVVVDGEVKSQGSYPGRDALAQLVGLALPKSAYTDAVNELVAIAASIASNCEGCFRYHYGQARKLGVSKEDVARAVATARAVRDLPGRAVLQLAEKYLGTAIESTAAPSACCAPADAEPASSSGCRGAATATCG